MIMNALTLAPSPARPASPGRGPAAPRRARIPGTKLVRAIDLPRTFFIPSTHYKGGPASAERVGRKVRVRFLGHVVYLAPSARVRVVKSSLDSREGGPS
jgi:hypothetical protein